MKYLKQFGIILVIAFLGEVLHWLLPLPIPAGIYGIVLLFAGLELHIIPLTAVKDTADLLIAIMPVMFIPPAVELIDAWPLLRPVWPAYLLITVITTFLVMAATGRVTQSLLRRETPKEERDDE